MITNNSLTIYHLNKPDEITHNESWTRYNYKNVWVFNTQRTNINKGYDDTNNIEIRIPYETNGNLNIENFSVGDIIVEGSLNIDIESQDDLLDYLTYNITSINNNNFGTQKHIHIGGR